MKLQAHRGFLKDLIENKLGEDNPNTDVRMVGDICHTNVRYDSIKITNDSPLTVSFIYKGKPILYVTSPFRLKRGDTLTITELTGTNKMTMPHHGTL